MFSILHFPLKALLGQQICPPTGLIICQSSKNPFSCTDLLLFSVESYLTLIILGCWSKQAISQCHLDFMKL